VKALSEGQYIKHFQYGCLHGVKKFVTGLMVVEPAEGTPPKRSKRRKKAVAIPSLIAKVGAK